MLAVGVYLPCSCFTLVARIVHLQNMLLQARYNSRQKVNPFRSSTATASPADSTTAHPLWLVFCSKPVTSRLKVVKINVSRSTTRQTAPGCHAARAAPLWSTYRLITLKYGAPFLCCSTSWNSTPGVTYGGTREWSSIPWMTSPNMKLGDQCDDGAWSSCGLFAQVMAMLPMDGTPFCTIYHSLSYGLELSYQFEVCHSHASCTWGCISGLG